MKIPILVEPTENARFAARAGEPFAMCAEGATANEAAALLIAKLQERLAAGAELLFFEVPNGATTVPQVSPSFPADELYKTDPDFRAWQELIAENRRLEDDTENRQATADREAS